jgi:inosine-uridine nucleoside N-ribohydrolase
VIDPTLLTTGHRGVVVDTGPEPSRGRTHVDLQGWHWEPNARVAVDIDAERFLGMLVERISSLG